ncbi:hypothetical protein QBC47DRAFT_179053 [Echria macrotheca]|uniref:Uncharacterized protein n=1 Tax=Echria macrotheca TaxID=438768 RepID=A0AAJ0FA67_9PEZI|nr:hypothetical protein QBC47DRAFT_179053 [Echria macrotheca]
MAEDCPATDRPKNWDFYESWTARIPRSSTLPFKCFECRVEFPGAADFAAATSFRKHVSTTHPELEGVAAGIFNYSVYRARPVQSPNIFPLLMVSASLAIHERVKLYEPARVVRTSPDDASDLWRRRTSPSPRPHPVSNRSRPASDNSDMVVFKQRRIHPISIEEPLELSPEPKCNEARGTGDRSRRFDKEGHDERRLASKALDQRLNEYYEPDRFYRRNIKPERHYQPETLGVLEKTKVPLHIYPTPPSKAHLWGCPTGGALSVRFPVAGGTQTGDEENVVGWRVAIGDDDGQRRTTVSLAMESDTSLFNAENLAAITHDNILGKSGNLNTVAGNPLVFIPASGHIFDENCGRETLLGPISTRKTRCVSPHFFLALGLWLGLGPCVVAGHSFATAAQYVTGSASLVSSIALPPIDTSPATSAYSWALYTVWVTAFPLFVGLLVWRRQSWSQRQFLLAMAFFVSLVLLALLAQSLGAWASTPLSFTAGFLAVYVCVGAVDRAMIHLMGGRHPQRQRWSDDSGSSGDSDDIGDRAGRW